MSKRSLALLAATAFLWSTKAAHAQEPEKLTLRRAVTLAVQNSRDLALARVQYNIAESETGVYRSGFQPNLYTGSGAAYTSGFPATPGGNAPSVFNLSYTQAIFDLPLRGQVKAAEERAVFDRKSMMAKLADEFERAVGGIAATVRTR